jgi:hypothetical protein
MKFIKFFIAALAIFSIQFASAPAAEAAPALASASFFQVRRHAPPPKRHHRHHRKHHRVVRHH